MASAMAGPMQRCIKEPVKAIFDAWDLLTKAADTHLRGDYITAASLFRAANLSEVWHWGNPASGPSPRALRLNIRCLAPENDTRSVPMSCRDPKRHPPREVKMAVLVRDGFRCRYCGIPVIDASIRRIACELYPDDIVWVNNNEREQHAAFQCFWLQYDHIVPHSHGGQSSVDNVVVSCHLCNFGKAEFTLRQLTIADPRLTPPVPVSWDGLERLRAAMPRRLPARKLRGADRQEISNKIEFATSSATDARSMFLPGAWISKGYLYTPPLDGKDR